MDVKPEEKQEILETIDVGARMDKVSRLLAHRIEVLRLSQRDRPADQGGARRAPARGAAARADGGDPAAARRRRRGQGRRDRRARARRSPRPRCRRRSRSRRARSCAGSSACRKRRRIRHGAHLSRLADRAALGAARGEADRHRRGAAHPRRGPLRPREDQAAHPRIPRGAQARAAGQGADPVLRRPARRRQDLARPVDRARHGPQVRARQPRRRARRGRDPRPPPHLYRRAARQHHPGDPQGRRAQLRDDARRDRQARRRHPGRSGVGAARGARSRAEQHLPRQLPRRAVRPQPRGVHHHRQHARHHSRAAARPHGDHQARRLHRRARSSQIARRYLVRRQLEANGLKPEQVEIADDALRDDHRATTRARPACATSSARSARCCAMPRCGSPKGRADAIRIDVDDLADDPRAAAVRERGRDAHQRAGRRDRPRLDAGRRRHPVHRGDAHARAAAG